MSYKYIDLWVGCITVVHMSKVLQVRVNDDKMLEYEKAAEKAGVAVSKWVRDVLDGELSKVPVLADVVAKPVEVSEVVDTTKVTGFAPVVQSKMLPGWRH